MNIFALHLDPEKAAEMHCDTHCNKMILESAQMLSTAAHVATGRCRVFIKANGKKGYLEKGSLSRIYSVDRSHIFHPCTEWAYSSRECFEWLTELSLALESEKIYRTGTGNKAADVIRKCIKYGKQLPSLGLLPFAQAMPDEFRSKNHVTAYRRFYVQDKAHLLEYTRRQPPRWLAKHFQWEEFQLGGKK